ncbi:thioredoxin domain-containing protein [Parasegetibacter sp. NRK P23]|uniref:thioredoxin domain-containing protein n=1 Tax=Parasegetibacter sp. NRK P23 TaxID=2942999 RepID=UPI002043D177|nr:thioredoxin domain-containing protein [Parasegetibacter sp. NRK P23]MCM5527548.1 thioredoxin domain-containing protein [Parasegetibacter sp. NRK P23]
MHTNRLISESSPYLLQHAHNPVDWYPWGPEALLRAQTEQKPILVSIGYSACHWCHVMERESFENEEVAAFMNQHFINIKIDREERPDLDHIYMDAVQAITGSGGWPLNVFLTPDRKPFYGGTYFPPQPMHNRASWLDVLAGISAAFNERRHEIESQAENLTAHLLNANTFGAGKQSESADTDWLHRMKNNIMQQADTTEGGFGRAPKFPQTFSIRYLLRYAHLYKDEQALKQALLSLDKMCAGGIYDQIGGGFARYSVDNEWLAPHFEKMLYDNALLIYVLCEAFQLSGNKRYEEVVRETIAFLQREMRASDGGYYAALDADSEGVEGKFYVWSYDDFMKSAGPDAPLAAVFYDVSPEGNWEHTNILRLKNTVAEFAAQNGMSEEEWEERLNEVKGNLLAARSKRVRPGLDDKILLSWNALMLSALCKAAGVFGEEAWKQEALTLAGFLEQQFDAGNHTYLHTAKNGEARYPAFLDDLSFWVRGLLDLQELTGDNTWLQKAGVLTGVILKDFSDEEGVFCYYTSATQDDVVIRKKETYDGAVPSGNAVLCGNLLRLSVLLGKEDWGMRASKMLEGFGQTASRYPTSFGEWADCLMVQLNGLKEIVILGAGWEKHLKELLLKYIPGKVVQAAAQGDDQYPLMAGKPTEAGSRIFLCEQYACKQPVFTVEELMQLLVNQ